MKRIIITLASAAALAACDGPAEDAGEKADNAAGVVDGEDTIESGPNETMGERRDASNDAAEDAKEAQADALEDAAEAERAAAQQNASALEEKAARIRER